MASCWSKAVFKIGLVEREKPLTKSVAVVVLDEFTDFTTIAAGGLSHAAEAINPLRLAKHGSEAPDTTQQLIQHMIHGWLGKKEKPLARGPAHAARGAGHGAIEEKCKVMHLFTETVCQCMVDVHGQPKPTVGNCSLSLLTDGIGTKVPDSLPELKRLGMTVKDGRLACWPTSTK